MLLAAEKKSYLIKIVEKGFCFDWNFIVKIKLKIMKTSLYINLKQLCYKQVALSCSNSQNQECIIDLFDTEHNSSNQITPQHIIEVLHLIFDFSNKFITIRFVSFPDSFLVHCLPHPSPWQLPL